MLSVAESPAPVQPVQTVQTPAVSASPSPSPEPSANEYVYRIERDGSMVIKRDAEIPYCRVSVPYYWGETESTSTSVRLTSESENCIAAIQMEVTMNSGDDYSWFKDRDVSVLQFEKTGQLLNLSIRSRKSIARQDI